MVPAIVVENLSKKFIIRHEVQERYTSMRDVIARKTKKIFSFPDALASSKPDRSVEDFWALRGIDFNINQGDRVGIIGRNGAGKSTLLKVLSRITEPTAGRVRINGRVACLLEVGTGFHPELTGRENIYLNGAILGMSRAEIKRKFDEIVDFAEVENFLDTPVKRYSSGMYVRLAFAVAAHLEPEILIVDEVLAVGDAQFQKKCLGKMEEVSKNQGRTVLFVSHNMNVVKSLCNYGILLSEGKILEKGNINSLISKYLSGSDVERKSNYSHKEGGKVLKIIDVIICGKKNPLIRIGDKLQFKIGYESKEFKGDSEFFVLIYNSQGICIQGIFQTDCNKFATINNINGEILLEITNNFVPGKYFISVGCFDRYRNFLDWVEYCEQFEIDQLFTDDRVFLDRLGELMSNDAKWTMLK